MGIGTVCRLYCREGLLVGLDVHLVVKEKIKVEKSSGIFVRRNGRNIEITRKEWDELYPGKTPVQFIQRKRTTHEAFSAHITHNLNRMADAAGLYYALWHPEEKQYKTASDIIPVLEMGLGNLETHPDIYKKLNPDNGWGSYESLVEFVREYLEACKKYPDAKLEVSR